MAEIKSFPNNQDEYEGAEYVMKWFHGRTSGVFGAEGNCSATAVQDMMAVDISDGEGWMSNDNADGVVWWIDSEKTSGSKLRLNFDVADGVLDRIDSIVVSWETTNYVARPTVTVLKGTPSSGPVPPPITNNATLRQIAPYDVHIKAGTLSLTNSMIVDRRLDPARCGIVTETVKVDTSVINEQVTTMLSELNAEAAAVLKSILDELADLEAGTAVELKKLQFNNVEVLPSDFEENTEYPEAAEEGYDYMARVPLEGVLESMLPVVTFGPKTAGTMLNSADTYNGGIIIYTNSIPDAAITIPTIWCWRGSNNG